MEITKITNKENEGKKMITLTTKEILDLARMTGLDVDESGFTDDQFETEFTICKAHPEGVKVEEMPDQPPQHYRFVAYLSEYPEEGVNPLGNPLPAK